MTATLTLTHPHTQRERERLSTLGQISSHCLHCHSVIAGDRGVCAVECLRNFTLERKRQHRQTYFRAPKEPLFTFHWAREETPPHCRALQRKKKQQSTFIFPHNYNFTLKGSELKLQTHWTACCLATFKEYNVWFIFFPSLSSLRVLACCFVIYNQTSWDETLVWLSNGCVAFKSSRPLLLHFDTRGVWNTCISFKVVCFGD